MKNFLLPTRKKILASVIIILYIFINIIIMSFSNCSSRCSDPNPLETKFSPIVYAPTMMLMAPMAISNIQIFQEPYTEFYTSKNGFITVNDPSDIENLKSETRYRTTKEGVIFSIVVEIVFIYLLACTIIFLNKKWTLKKKFNL